MCYYVPDIVCFVSAWACMVHAVVVLAPMPYLCSGSVAEFLSVLAVAGILIIIQSVTDEKVPPAMPCRSLDAYWEYAQIDVKERVANSAEKFCKKHVKKREPEPETLRPQPAVKQKKKPEKRSLRSMLSVHITGFR